MRKNGTNRASSTANPFLHHLPDNLLRALVRQSRIINPKTVLVVSSNESTILKHLQKTKVGLKRTGFTIKSDDVERLPFKNSTFDLVLCCDVLERLNNPKKALAELHRVTRHYVILSVPNEPWFRLVNFLSGKNVFRFGNDPKQQQHWSGDSFEAFAGTKFSVFTRRQPFPWTVVVGEKV